MLMDRILHDAGASFTGFHPSPLVRDVSHPQRTNLSGCIERFLGEYGADMDFHPALSSDLPWHMLEAFYEYSDFGATAFQIHFFGLERTHLSKPLCPVEVNSVLTICG